jgi:hypothetical protein
MNLPNIVCPYNPALLNRLKGQVIVMRVEGTESISKTVADVAQSGNQLRQMIVETNLPLDSIEYRDEWKDIPLTIRASSFGKFRNLVKKLDIMRRLSLCVYLPCTDHTNMVGLRILSSVGIRCGVTFEGDVVDWEDLADLMTYAVFERTPHAPIEPFMFIATNYKSNAYTDWGTVYCDHPSTFLHLDSEGHVALSHKELNKKQFIAMDYFAVTESSLLEAIEQRSQAWRQYFVDNRVCARCPAWRICLGKFDPGTQENTGCAAFLSEMMEAAEQYQIRQIRPAAR